MDENENVDVPAVETPVPTPETVELVDHVITQEDLDLNPELVAEGIVVGDVIGLPITDTPLTPEEIGEIIKQRPELAGKLPNPAVETPAVEEAEPAAE
jgi:hypothetical protein